MIRRIFFNILIAGFLALSAPAGAQELDKFVGTWTSRVMQGKHFLIVKKEGDRLKLEAPTNPELRTEFRHVRVEGGRLLFEQLNYLLLAPEHPYNGVVNYSEIWEENGKMYYRISTQDQPNFPPDEILRVEDLLPPMSVEPAAARDN